MASTTEILALACILGNSDVKYETVRNCDSEMMGVDSNFVSRSYSFLCERVPSCGGDAWNTVQLRFHDRYGTVYPEGPSRDGGAERGCFQ